MAGMLEQLLSLAAAGAMMISTSLNAAAPQNDIDGTLFLQNRQWRAGSAYIPEVRVTEMKGKVRELRDDAAAALEDEGRFEAAIRAFERMNGYSDSNDRIAALEEKFGVHIEVRLKQ